MSRASLVMLAALLLAGCELTPTVADVVAAAAESAGYGGLDGCAASIPVGAIVDCVGPHGEFPVRCNPCSYDLDGNGRTSRAEVLVVAAAALRGAP